jgi:hypothetical protein
MFAPFPQQKKKRFSLSSVHIDFGICERPDTRGNIKLSSANTHLKSGGDCLA